MTDVIVGGVSFSYREVDMARALPDGALREAIGCRERLLAKGRLSVESLRYLDLFYAESMRREFDVSERFGD